MEYGWILKSLKKKAHELGSGELEELFDGVLAEAELLKDQILTTVEREKNQIQGEIDALTRLLADKDYTLEINRLRAARVHELVARLKDEIDGSA